MTTPFSRRMGRVRPSAIRDLLRLGADPEIISFGGGYPDPDLFPLDGLDQVFHEAIVQQGRQALQYTVSTGLPRLREQIAERMTKDGTPTAFDNVLILQGGQQGLDLVAKLLIDPGDLIVTENPTFLGALIAFNPCEPSYSAVPMDGEGLDTEALEEILKARPCKFIYTIPDFQNPTGVSMSLSRRKRIVELANQYETLILEDAPYREIRYEGAPLPTLKSFDTEGRVIHLGSFSKVLAPGLRTGWVVAEAAIVERLGLLKLAADTQNSTLNMAAVSLFLDRFDVDEQLSRIRQTYKLKKDHTVSLIREHFPQEISFTDPEGGMFTWLTFPDGFDAAEFMLQQALPKVKVAYVPGATFYPTVEETNHARVSFATQSNEQIEKGIRALGGLLTTYLHDFDRSM